MPTAAAPPMARSAQLFHALSDATRLAILDLLQDGEHCVCDLQAALDAAQSRLSFHLKVLKDAGLVRDRRDGRWAYYEIDRDVIDEIGSALLSLHPGFDRPVARRRALPLIRERCC